MTTLPIMPGDSSNILVASANRAIRQSVIDSFHALHCRIGEASGGAEALLQLEQGRWQKVFLDPQQPDLDASELAQTIKKRFPDLEVVALEVERPSEATTEEPERGFTSRSHNNWHAAAYGYHAACSRPASSPLPGMIGCSPRMFPVYRAARLLAKRDTTVLITGATGSGKEIVARGIHSLSSRATHGFVVVNCAAIPEALLESELFGYARGAYTGATQSYAGKIQSAHGGTLLLDEIGDMPLSLQPKLLRFLELKEVQRLGSSEVSRVDARVIAATNADLPGLVRQKRFREDLFYRLSTFPLAIPSLRERVEDIALLAKAFVKNFSPGAGVPVISPAAKHMLESHSWGGNVRELQNVMERASILAEGEAEIRREHLMLEGDMSA
jgi:DNA-binding NtrC family response regulator